MKLEIPLKAGTPKEVVSSIRSIVSQGSLSYEERINLVSRLILEHELGVKPAVAPPAPVQNHDVRKNPPPIVVTGVPVRSDSKRVYMYALDGMFEMAFPTLSSARDYVHGYKDPIRKRCLGKSNAPYRGHYFSYSMQGKWSPPGETK